MIGALYDDGMGPHTRYAARSRITTNPVSTTRGQGPTKPSQWLRSYTMEARDRPCSTWRYQQEVSRNFYAPRTSWRLTMPLSRWPGCCQASLSRASSHYFLTPSASAIFRASNSKCLVPSRWLSMTMYGTLSCSRTSWSSLRYRSNKRSTGTLCWSTVV
jgi:hypothetical protein